MAYCEVNDMVFGDVAITTEARSQLDPQKYVDDAADEIDSHIGFVYATPVPVEEPSTPRPVRLLLKRINAHLATGRLVMAAASLAQDDRLHAYGIHMVETAQTAIIEIATTAGSLPGVPVAELPGSETGTDAPKVLQYVHDSTSGVDAFYAYVRPSVNPGAETFSWGR